MSKFEHGPLKKWCHLRDEKKGQQYINETNCIHTGKGMIKVKEFLSPFFLRKKDKDSCFYNISLSYLGKKGQKKANTQRKANYNYINIRSGKG